MSLPEDSIDENEVQKAKKHMRNSLIWLGFNALLLTGGIASFLIAEFPLLLIGIVIFCPYSIAKNGWKYYKVKKALAEYLQ